MFLLSCLYFVVGVAATTFAYLYLLFTATAIGFCLQIENCLFE